MAKPTGLPSEGSPDGSPGKRRDPREMARLVVAVVALVLLVAFVVANSHTVKVGFVFFHTRTSLIWVIVIAAVLGALVDRLVMLVRKRRKASVAKAHDE
jgi:uncharacterized integral membrane protein